ncbi:hypothetical protein BFP76_08670 [Amylibacter kogurei]|uniref:LPS-assembly lipoprotein n=1 Tax=Paramylibacter kogurei TaxID=1889778 RepID=A0A2G5K1U4_9RHOB|nr:LPS assembly lipoprotein LptE [Amylibacter kogurei]PIB23089.1 hypothetical protein BFP76_08670 [Amylibacter kogurei]
MSLFNRRTVLMGGGLATLSACGFEPVYGTGKASSAIIGKIEIQEQNGRSAFELRDRLQNRLGVADANAPYFLIYQLTVEEDDLVVTSEAEITRYNLAATAEYKVFERGSNKVVFSDVVTTTTSYSATSETYPTRVAERGANVRLSHSIADQMFTRLSITAKDWLA